MKKSVLLFAMLLMIFSNVYSAEEVSGDKASRESSLNLVTTPGLYDLANMWAGEYGRMSPGVRIRISIAQNANIANLLDNGADAGFITSDRKAPQESRQLWKLTVGHDVIVPVMNAQNPFLKGIYQAGISPEKFASVLIGSQSRVWGNLCSEGQDKPVHFYIINDESVISGVKNFLVLNHVPADAIFSGTAAEMISAMQSDPYAVGFCKLVSITGPDKLSLAANISFLPIDKNGNGKLDYVENIYDNPDVFARGVWIGKYPKALYNDVNFVSEVQPANSNEAAFLKWILTDGQQYLFANGYSDLVYSERQSKLDKFNINIPGPAAKDIYTIPFIALIAIIIIMLVSILVSTIIYYRRVSKSSHSVEDGVSPLVFSENSIVVPKGLYYDKTHSWAFMEKDGIVKLGIDDFLMHITGKVTRVEMKKPGDKIRKGDIMLSIIQKGKQLNIYSPVSGTIREHNKSLINDSSLINASPYTDGWVYMIEPANWLREIQFLEMAAKYRIWLLGEFLRLKDFLAVTMKADRLEYEAIVLQDGGPLKDGILADFGPEIWEDFQTNFLDTYK